MLNPQFIVEPYLSGIRVDSFLSRHLRNFTAWRLHRMVCHGLVSIDHMPAGSSDRVFAGQCVAIRLNESPDHLLSEYPIDLSIVYEDPWLIVIDKQAGQVAHPVGEFQEETLSNALQSHFDRQTAAPGLLRPGIVHRLDRMTSGLLVAAKEHMTHRLLSIDFQFGRLSKQYLALIEGDPEFESREINLPIGQRPGGNSILMSGRPGALNARPARTRADVVERLDGCTLIRCQLFTGRNHQIRVHLSEIGHPVVGDEFYGAFGRLRCSRDCDPEGMERRHALHAASLGFMHPILRTWMKFETSPPDDFWSTKSALSAGD